MNKNKDVDMGYITFGNIRMKIANSYDEKVGNIYRNFMLSFDYKMSKEEEEYIYKTLPDCLLLFLFHSDCDGKLTNKEVKAIYKELIKLNVNVNNCYYKEQYNEMIKLFQEGLTIKFV